MNKTTLITQTERKFISAGLKARALRKQLAVTFLASTEIIEAMRALRKGIPTANSVRESLEQDKTTVLLNDPSESGD